MPDIAQSVKTAAPAGFTNRRGGQNGEASYRIHDRRVAERVDIDRPCKLQRKTASPFDRAKTINLSTSGALIELRTSRPPVAGEEVSVAVAWTKSPVIGRDTLVPARVIRSIQRPAADWREGQITEVAVEFLRERAMAAAA